MGLVCNGDLSVREGVSVRGSPKNLDLKPTLTISFFKNIRNFHKVSVRGGGVCKGGDVCKGGGAGKTST